MTTTRGLKLWDYDQRQITDKRPTPLRLLLPGHIAQDCRQLAAQWDETPYELIVRLILKEKYERGGVS